jgi:hypothetical protein
LNAANESGLELHRTPEARCLLLHASCTHTHRHRHRHTRMCILKPPFSHAPCHTVHT